MLPNPNSQRGIELQQAHVELVMRVLGLDEEDVIRAFEPVIATGAPSRAPAIVACRDRVFWALSEARVNGAGLTAVEIALVTGVPSHSTVVMGCRRAKAAQALTPGQVTALREGGASTHTPVIPAGEHA